MQFVQTEQESRVRERTILLRKIFDGLTVIKLGKELHEPYCNQFSENGYDANYKYYNEDEVVRRVAETISDTQLLDFARRNQDKLKKYWDFHGQFYTYHASRKELLIENSWPEFEQKLESVKAKHGKAVLAVLQAYKELKEDWSFWSACDYNRLAYRAKELGGKGWRKALIALEVAGIMDKRGSGRRPGERSIPMELMPLIESVLKKWENDEGPLVEITEPRKISQSETIFSDLFSKVPNAEWDAELIEKAAKILNAMPNDKSVYDNVMQTMTKLVENRLRQALSRWVEGEISEDKFYGMKLVDFARQKGFIKLQGKEPEPFYHLLSWYFLELRNTSHHVFKDYPISAFITNLTVTNYILQEIEQRVRGSRPLHIPITLDKREYFVGESVNLESQIVKANGTPFTDGKVMAKVTSPDGVKREYPMKHTEEGNWLGSFPTLQCPPGTVAVTIKASDISGHYAAASGVAVIVTVKKDAKDKPDFVLSNL